MKSFHFASVALLLGSLGIAAPFVCGAAEIPQDRPAERMAPLLPDEPRPAPPLDLPPLTPPAQPAPADMRVRVGGFRIVGHTVFSSEQLATVTAPYVGRELTNTDLESIRLALTRYYIERGYINSGAVLPDQDVTRGVITYRIVEGRLERIEVRGLKRLPDSYIRERLALAATPPLSVYAIRDRLFLLQQDPRLQRLNAELLPGTRPGEAVLRVEADEAPSRRAYVTVNNYRPPSVGANRAELELSDTNLLGVGDLFGFRGGLTEGSRDVELNYAIPLTAHDTTLQLRYVKGRSKVIEAPFDELDVESENQTVGAGLWFYPHKTPQQELGLGFSFELRQSRSMLLGEPFAFSSGTPPDGKVRLSVLRLTQSWLQHSPARVLSARSTFSIGVNAFEPTLDYHGEPGANFGEPDARFTAWLGQVQWVERLFARRDELVLRYDTQITNEPLLSMEQFSLGGARSVRGYRENFLVRDMGLLASAEYRYTLWSDPVRGHRVQAATFFDWGRAWQSKGDTPEPKTLASAGLGLRATYNPWLEFEVYYGSQLHKVERLDNNLQDKGIHAQLRVRVW